MDAVPFWWHSIDFGDGEVSRGRQTAEDLEKILESMQLPSLEGKTVLDIGAWDGYYSFTAGRLGARRVAALDKYVWSLNVPGSQRLEQLVGADERGALVDVPGSGLQRCEGRQLEGRNADQEVQTLPLHRARMALNRPAPTT